MSNTTQSRCCHRRFSTQVGSGFVTPKPVAFSKKALRTPRRALEVVNARMHARLPDGVTVAQGILVPFV